MGLRLIAFEIPSSDRVGVFFTNRGTLFSELTQQYEWLGGCKIKLDLLLEDTFDLINTVPTDVPFLSFLSESTDEKLILKELSGIGELLIERAELEGELNQIIKDQLLKVKKSTEVVVSEGIIEDAADTEADR